LKLSRLLFFGAIALVALALTAALVVQNLPTDELRTQIERRLTDSLDRDVKIGGDLHFSLFPGLRLEASDVVVTNPPGSEFPKLLQVRELQLEIALSPLLRGRVELSGLSLTDADIHLEPSKLGTPAPGERLDELADEQVGTAGFKLKALSLRNVRIFARDKDQHVRSVTLTELDLAAESLKETVGVRALGEFEGNDFHVTGELGPLSQLMQPTQPYPIELSGELLDARVQLSGTALRPTELSGLDLSAKLAFASFGETARDLGYPIPELGAVEIEGRITDPDGVLGIDPISLRTTGAGEVHAKVNGAIRDVRALRGVELRVELDSPDLDFAGPFIDLPIPQVDRVQVQGTVSGSGSGLGVRGSVRADVQDGAVTLEIVGSQDDVTRIERLDAHATLVARDLEALGSVLGISRVLPAIGGVRAEGHLHGKNGALGVDNLLVEVADESSHTWVRVVGAVGDVTALAQVQLDVHFGAEDLRHVEQVVGRKVPPLRNVVAHARLSDSDGTLGIEHLTVDAGGEGALTVGLRARFDDLREVSEIEVDLDLGIPDLQALGETFDLELPALPPLEFSGRVSGSDEELKSSGRITAGRTTLQGDSTLRLPPGGRPSLETQLHSDRVHLPDFGFGRASTPAVAAGPIFRDAARDGAFSLEQLRSFDADVRLDLASITGAGQFNVREAHLEAVLKNGDLSVENYGVSYQGGRIVGRARFNTAPNVPRLSFEMDARGVDLTPLLTQLDPKTQSAGRLDAVLSLTSRGRTRAQWVEHLSGSVRSKLVEGRFASRYAERFLKEVALTAFVGFEREPVTELSCIYGTFAVRDGIARTDDLFLGGSKVTVTGEGSIYLNGDKYRLTMTPHAHNPGLVSVAATVKVRGSLADPQFIPVPRTIVTSAARGVISNALRPIGAVVGRVLPGRGKAEATTPCDAPL
jgi:uncharacterized protein involved in outer membrane biogenesis